MMTGPHALGAGVRKPPREETASRVDAAGRRGRRGRYGDLSEADSGAERQRPTVGEVGEQERSAFERAGGSRGELWRARTGVDGYCCERDRGRSSTR